MILADKIIYRKKKEWMDPGGTCRKAGRHKTIHIEMGECSVGSRFGADPPAE